MTKPAVCHWEVMGRDGDKTRAFFAQLFEWDVQKWEGSDYGMVQSGGEGTIGGGLGGVRPGDNPGIIVYVQVDDLQKYLDRAEKLGAKTIVPPSPIPGIGQFAVFADLDGIPVGLFKAGE